MVTAPSSTSLASQGEADESGETAGKKDGKKGKVGSHYAEPGALAGHVSTTDWQLDDDVCRRARPGASSAAWATASRR